MKRFFEKEPSQEKSINKQERFKIIDIVPEKEKYSTPVVVAPGWATTSKDLERFSKLLSEKGRRVISFDHLRENIIQGPLSLIHSKKEVTETGKEYSFEEIQKAFSLLEILKEKKIEKADVIAYSEAGINVSIAASECPEKFRNIIYVSPAGMIGRDKFPKLLGRFSMESIKSAINSFANPEVKKAKKTQLKEFLNYVKENILLSIKETIAISKSDIKEMVKSLKEKGVSVSIVHGKNDVVFPIEKMKKEADFLDKDKFFQYKGGHFDSVLEPEKIVDLINNALISSNEEKK